MTPHLDLDELARHHRAPPPLLLELEQHSRRDGVASLSRITGRLLSTLVHAMQANRILEIGTGYGVATLWMAFAMPPAGRIWTVDPNLGQTAVALEYLERAGKRDAIEVSNQPAAEELAVFPQRNLDIVFVDGRCIDGRCIDDETFVDLCVPLLKRSGLLIVDRLLPSAGERDAMGSDAAGRTSGVETGGDGDAFERLQPFREAFLHHPELDALILPIGEGVGIGARTA